MTSFGLVSWASSYQYPFHGTPDDLERIIVETLAPVVAEPLQRRTAVFRGSALRSKFDPLPPYAPFDIDGDVVFVVLTSMDALERFEYLKLHRRRSGPELVGVLIEAWLPELGPLESLLDRIVPSFRHLFVCGLWAGEELARRYGNCSYLPLGVDAGGAAFRPADHRPVLAFNPGRRSAAQHALLQEVAGGLYLYDTLQLTKTVDLGEHRATYLSLIARSQAMVCNYAKFNDPVIGSNQEHGARILECLLGGAVPIGSFPSGEASLKQGIDEQLLGPNLPLDDCGGLSGPWDQLVPVRTRERAAVAGPVSVLTGHDWSHRIATMLDSLGLQPTPALDHRIERLRTVAASFDQHSPA